MKKWEYQVVNLGYAPSRSDEERERSEAELLNRFGAVGWELVAVIYVEGNSLAYLKREKA
jgi:hypothetical protein